MRTILLQLDTDALPSSFDRVVAVDAGAEHVFAYGGVTTEDVESLVHGAIFTRSPDDSKQTAIFIGGSDVAAGEALFEKAQRTFFGPMRVSVMLDSNGSNTTAAAAVLAAKKHLDLAGTEALVLGGTGPVGQRTARLLARQGAHVRLASRTSERAEKTCARILECVPEAHVVPCENGSDESLRDIALIVASGAPGVRFLSAEQLAEIDTLRVAIDLNAVPPSGLADIAVTDEGKEESGVIRYGAIGVGGTKMKIHKAAIRTLFESNDALLDTEAIFALGENL